MPYYFFFFAILWWILQKIYLTIWTVLIVVYQIMYTQFFYSRSSYSHDHSLRKFSCPKPLLSWSCFSFSPAMIALKVRAQSTQWRNKWEWRRYVTLLVSSLWPTPTLIKWVQNPMGICAGILPLCSAKTQFYTSHFYLYQSRCHAVWIHQYFCTLRCF